MFTHLGSKFFGLLAISSTKSPSGFVIRRAALTIGLGGAESVVLQRSIKIHIPSYVSKHLSSRQHSHLCLK